LTGGRDGRRPEKREAHLAREDKDQSKPRHRGRPGSAGRSVAGATGVPKWVREEIVRSTPGDRREPALRHLSKAMAKFADERYEAALSDLRKAKKLAPRSSAVRELLGLSAYRSGRWEEALREVRAFRRIAGDLTHMPVEMDCLRALGRSEDVAKTWQRMKGHDVPAAVGNEARVVYASFLLDEGRPRDAWSVTKPGRLVASPGPGELRRWYVAARAALEAGDPDAAARIVAALDAHDVDFEGVDELRSSLS